MAKHGQLGEGYSLRCRIDKELLMHIGWGDIN